MTHDDGATAYERIREQDTEQATKWLGHRDLCPIQWGEDCDCELPARNGGES